MAANGGPRIELADRLTVVVLGAVAVAVVTAIALHVSAVGRLDPRIGTVSDYVSIPGGAALLAFAVLAITVATGAVAAGLARSGLPDPVLPCALLGGGGLGLLATIAFPTNHSGMPVSPDAIAHRYAAGLFFVTLPLAALLIGRRRPDAATRRMTNLGVLAGLAFLISHIPLVLPGFPGAHLIGTVLPRGLVERLLLVLDLGLLATLALANRRAAR